MTAHSALAEPLPIGHYVLAPSPFGQTLVVVSVPTSRGEGNTCVFDPS
jgi:hypothetical protein